MASVSASYGERAHELRKQLTREAGGGMAP
jgi:hypothetical protein